MVAIILAAGVSSSPVARGAPLRDASAAEIGSLFAAKDRPRLVHLWASWCAPCVAELPSLLATLRKRQGPLDVVFISLDSAEDAAAAARLLEENGGVPGQSLRAADDGVFTALEAFDARFQGDLPSTYLISQTGHLVRAQRGFTAVGALLAEASRLAKKGGPRTRAGKNSPDRN